MTGFLTDGVQSALERALDGVTQRQRVSAQNVANAMTPGYQAQQVTFEGALSDAVAQGEDASSAAITTSTTNDPSRGDGNNVDAGKETTSLVQSGLQYDALVQAMNYRFTVLHDAIKG